LWFHLLHLFHCFLGDGKVDLILDHELDDILVTEVLEVPPMEGIPFTTSRQFVVHDGGSGKITVCPQKGFQEDGSVREEIDVVTSDEQVLSERV